MSNTARLSAVGVVVLLLSSTFVMADALSTGQYANLVVGENDFATITNGTGQHDLSNPYGTAFDSSGNLWVADSNNSRVLEFAPPFSNGMQASLVIGQPNFTGFNPILNEAPPPTKGDSSGPTGLAFDSSGNLWVTDTGNSRVLEFAPPFSNGMQASLVIGQPSFTTSFGGGPGSRLYTPVPLAFDPSGNLWVADTGNRMLEFAPPFSNGMQASLVIGQPDFESFGGNVSQRSVHNPGGLAFDSSGDLWVADTGNSRVIEYLGGATTTMGTETTMERGSAAADQTAQTGITVNIDGSSAADGTAINIFSARLRANPLTAVTLAGANFYAVRVAGISDGKASICMSNASVDSGTTIEYYSSGSWVPATGIAKPAGAKVCGSIPVSALTSGYLSEGDLSSSPSTATTAGGPSPSLILLFGLLAVAAMVLVAFIGVRVRQNKAKAR